MPIFLPIPWVKILNALGPLCLWQCFFIKIYWLICQLWSDMFWDKICAYEFHSLIASPTLPMMQLQCVHPHFQPVASGCRHQRPSRERPIYTLIKYELMLDIAFAPLIWTKAAVENRQDIILGRLTISIGQALVVHTLFEGQFQSLWWTCAAARQATAWS